MTTSSCQHCSVLQFSLPPHKHFTGFLLRNVLWVGLGSVTFFFFFYLGKELVIVEKQVRVVLMYPDPSYLQNRHHPGMLGLWGGVVTQHQSTTFIFLECSGPWCVFISLS